MDTIPQITRDEQSTKRYRKACPPLRVKQYTPLAQIKNILHQPGITYAQRTEQNSYAPTTIDQVPQTDQSHQETSEMRTLKHDESPV
jgi:hypothetical protein